MEVAVTTAYKIYVTGVAIGTVFGVVFVIIRSPLALIRS